MKKIFFICTFLFISIYIQAQINTDKDFISSYVEFLERDGGYDTWQTEGDSRMTVISPYENYFSYMFWDSKNYENMEDWDYFDWEYLDSEDGEINYSILDPDGKLMGIMTFYYNDDQIIWWYNWDEEMGFMNCINYLNVIAVNKSDVGITDDEYIPNRDYDYMPQSID